MKSLLPILLALSLLLPAPAAAQEVLVGMTDTAAYFPLLRGRRVAVLANHTAVAPAAAFGAEAQADPAEVQTDLAEAQADPAAAQTDPAGRVHLVDLLHDRGFDLTGIFSPEHGFRGTADAGEHVRNSVDPATGIPIRSLYDGRARRPSAEAMASFDVLVVDMQDVGVRFYTYYISMLRMMEACADAGREVVWRSWCSTGPILSGVRKSRGAMLSLASILL